MSTNSTINDTVNRNKTNKIKHFLALGAIATASLASSFSAYAGTHDTNPYANNPNIDSVSAQQLAAFDKAFPDFKITFSANGAALPNIMATDEEGKPSEDSLPPVSEFNPQDKNDKTIEHSVAQQLVGEDNMPTSLSTTDEHGVALPDSVLSAQKASFDANMDAYNIMVNKTHLIAEKAMLETKETLARDYAQGFITKENVPAGVHVSLVRNFDNVNPLSETDNYNIESKIITISETYHEDKIDNQAANGHFEGEVYAYSKNEATNTPEMEKLAENHELSHDIIHHEKGGFIQIADTDLHLSAAEKHALLLDSKFRDTIDENTADTEGSNITLKTHNFDNQTLSSTEALKDFREKGAHVVRSNSIYDIDAHNSAYSLNNVLNNIDIIKNTNDPERLKQIAIENSTQGAIEGFQHYSKEHHYTLVGELNTKYKSDLNIYVYNAVNEHNPNFKPIDLTRENMSKHDNDIMVAYANQMKDDPYVQKFFNLNNQLDGLDLQKQIEKSVNNISPDDTSANVKEFTARNTYMMLHNQGSSDDFHVDKDGSTHSKSIDYNNKYWETHYEQLQAQLVKDSPIEQPKEMLGMVYGQGSTLDESKVTPENINDYAVKNAIYHNVQYRMDHTELGTVKLTDEKITQAMAENKVQAKEFPMNMVAAHGSAAAANGVNADPTDSVGELSDSISSLAVANIAKIRAKQNSSQVIAPDADNHVDNEVSQAKTFSLKDKIAANRAKLGLPSLDNTNQNTNTSTARFSQ